MIMAFCAILRSDQTIESIKKKRKNNRLRKRIPLHSDYFNMLLHPSIRVTNSVLLVLHIHMLTQTALTQLSS